MSWEDKGLGTRRVDEQWISAKHHAVDELLHRRFNMLHGSLQPDTSATFNMRCVRALSLSAVSCKTSSDTCHATVAWVKRDYA